MKGDFIGFSFDGIHSSELGIVRVSDGSRYTENLLPTISDKTVTIPGADGTYYYNSFYTQKPFTIQIAFDSLTDAQMRRLRTIFGDKKVHNLIFDELPFKAYKVKCTGTPNLKYIAFDVEDSSSPEAIAAQNAPIEDIYAPKTTFKQGRIFKGEGTLTFTAFYPFAFSVSKYSDSYEINNPWGSDASSFNLTQFKDAYPLVLSTTTKVKDGQQYQLDKVKFAQDDNGFTLTTPLYNPGDMPVHFKLSLKTKKDNLYKPQSVIPAFTLTYKDNKMEFNDIKLAAGDVGVVINTELNAIIGIGADGQVSGTIYNRFLKKGDFFKIPVANNTDELDISFMNITGAQLGGNIDEIESAIEYDYLFY